MLRPHTVAKQEDWVEKFPPQSDCNVALITREPSIPWNGFTGPGLPKEPWHEDEEHFAKRLKAAAEHVNAHFAVKGLRREMPARMRKLVHEKKGDRLKKWVGCRFV